MAQETDLKLLRKFWAKNVSLFLWICYLLSTVAMTSGFVGSARHSLLPRVLPSFSQRLQPTTTRRHALERMPADGVSDSFTVQKEAQQSNQPDVKRHLSLADIVDRPESPTMGLTLHQISRTWHKNMQALQMVFPDQLQDNSGFVNLFQKRNSDDGMIKQNFVVAYAPPFFGLGSVLFQPKGLITKSARGEQQTLRDASDFFVDAFWAGKVGGGPQQLNDRQRRSLTSTQFMEFRSRYAGTSRGQSELIVCQLPDGEVIGCAGIEMTPIPDGNLKAESKKRAPLMSNLAVSRKYRRKGIGELLVKEAEQVARLEWGANDCYLYVERRNTAAVKLYKKLGYRQEWIDTDAKTLIPTSNGNLLNEPTEIICMRKRLNAGIFGQLWPF